MTLFLLVLGLILFIGLVVVHEWGHFIAARRNGVEVEEFGIFFPPKLYKRRTKGGWDFTINALPLGGFVRLKGENDSDTRKGSFGAASLKAKVQIMAAGVFMNLVVAVGIFTVLALIGMPKLIENQFTVASDTKVVTSQVLAGYIDEGSPADKAGLESTDQITNIASVGDPTELRPNAKSIPIKSADELPSITKQFAGESVQITYIRDGVKRTAKAQLLTKQAVESSKKTDTPKGYLGIVPAEYAIQRSTWSAPVVAVGFTAQVTGLTFEGLGRAVAGLGSIFAGAVTGNTEARQDGQTKASSQVAGPVGIYFVLKNGSLLGIEYILLIIGIISLTLAIMNILPIPALDGGRLWLMLFTRAINKPLTQKQEEAINGIGFMILIGLIIVITFVDVKRFL